MQGKNPTIQPPLTRAPRTEDLQRLLKAVQMAGAPVQQPFSLDSGKKYLLKVQQGRGTTGLGKTSQANSSPLWSLVEGIQTIWEYNTTDLELIFNLVEEAIYSSTSKPTHSGPIGGGPIAGGPVGGTPAAALAVLEELAHSKPNGQSLMVLQPKPEAAVQTPAPGYGQMQLSGNLAELGVCDLFQSISVAKMTGRLDVTSGLESLEVYFEEGLPRRASFRSDSISGAQRDITGEEVLLEGMTWRTGFFQFNAALKSAERSPMRRLDMLLMEGATLVDYLSALDKAGLVADSVPVRSSQLTEADFEKALSEGIPVNMLQQKKIYMAFDGKATLEDVVRESNLPKSNWLPLVFNLSSRGLIGLKVKPQAEGAISEAPQSPQAKEAVKEAFQELLRPDTGLISYPLFMHFMEVEFQRALKLRLPFCLVIITVHKEGSGITEQLSSDDLKLVAGKMRSALEPYDHVGHYQTLDIGLILPHRPGVQAREMVKKMIDDFNAELAQSGNGVTFIWSVGLGCVPEDGIKLSAMVAKAEAERNSVKAGT